MAKKNQNDAAWIAGRGLVETHDAEIDRPVLRKPGFNGIPSFGEMEAVLSTAVRKSRTEQAPTRERCRDDRIVHFFHGRGTAACTSCSNG